MDEGAWKEWRANTFIGSFQGLFSPLIRQIGNNLPLCICTNSLFMVVGNSEYDIVVRDVAFERGGAGGRRIGVGRQMRATL